MSYGNLPSLTFLQEFSSIGTQLTKKNSEFTPHYVAIKCLACEENNFEIEHDDCLGGGRYCATDPDGPGPVSGRMVVQENLRQMCMFEQLENDSDYSRWFLFQKDFATTCISNKFNKECSIVNHYFYITKRMILLLKISLISLDVKYRLEQSIEKLLNLLELLCLFVSAFWQCACILVG